MTFDTQLKTTLLLFDTTTIAIITIIITIYNYITKLLLMSAETVNSVSNSCLHVRRRKKGLILTFSLLVLGFHTQTLIQM